MDAKSAVGAPEKLDFIEQARNKLIEDQDQSLKTLKTFNVLDAAIGNVAHHDPFLANGLYDSMLHTPEAQERIEAAIARRANASVNQAEALERSMSFKPVTFSHTTLPDGSEITTLADTRMAPKNDTYREFSDGSHSFQTDFPNGRRVTGYFLDDNSHFARTYEFPDGSTKQRILTEGKHTVSGMKENFEGRIKPNGDAMGSFLERTAGDRPRLTETGEVQYANGSRLKWHLPKNSLYQRVFETAQGRILEQINYLGNVPPYTKEWRFPE